MAFATYQDIEERWRTLTADEQTRAIALLDDASAMLTALVRIDTTDQQQAALLKQVSCSMVIRSLVAFASSAFGVDQMQASMGPFGQTVHYANPSGDMYLTKLEKQLLGIVGGSGKGRILNPTIGGDLVAQYPDAL